jgi:uncharacterized SAM-binding protein YcdF (DUF218 family)
MLKRLTNTLALAILVAGVVGVAGFFVYVGSLDRSEAQVADRADGIVALTGGAERIGDAMELLAQGRGGRLLITGVNEKTTREELARQRPDLRTYFGCCVDLDYRALNTIGNAEQTRRWVRQNGFGSLLVVTSTYHMPRSLAELGHVLPDVRLIPHAVVPEKLDMDGWWREPGTMRLLLIEYAKLVMAKARIGLGRTTPAGPDGEPAPGVAKAAL